MGAAQEENRFPRAWGAGRGAHAFYHRAASDCGARHCRADQDQRRPRELVLLHLRRQVAQLGHHDLLVRPRHAIEDRRRRFRRIGAEKLLLHGVGEAGAEENAERRAVLGQRGKRLARRHLRFAFAARQDDGLHNLGQGEFGAQHGRRRLKGAHAGHHVVFDTRFIQPRHLLLNGACRGWCLRTEAARRACRHGRAISVSMTCSRVRCAELTRRALPGEVAEHGFRNERAGIDDDVRTLKQVACLECDKVRVSRARADEDHPARRRRLILRTPRQRERHALRRQVGRHDFLFDEQPGRSGGEQRRRLGHARRADALFHHRGRIRHRCNRGQLLGGKELRAPAVPAPPRRRWPPRRASRRCWQAHECTCVRSGAPPESGRCRLPGRPR